MPLYDYQCRSCRKTVEVRHGFKETYAEACAECGGEMARVFTPAPILFKGSGFYLTDSRKSAESSSGGKSTTSDAAPAATDAAPAATPAPAAPAAPKSESAA